MKEHNLKALFDAKPLASEFTCSCGESAGAVIFPEGHGPNACDAEPTAAEVQAAVDAYVATMDPTLRGGLMPEAVRQGMYPALIAAFTERAKKNA